MTDTSLHPPIVQTTSRSYIGILRFLITIAVPILLVMGSVRIVMTPLFLQLEYNRSGFPEDFYGFNTDNRLEYAPYALNYLLNNADISYLENLELPAELCQYGFDRKSNTCEMYNQSELGHMKDVKVVTRGAFGITILTLALTIIISFYLWRSQQVKQLSYALFQGSLVTIALIIAIIIVAVVAWDSFFDTFHQLFFADGTWRFAYSDTLIRLFPEQFWFDAAITIGTLTTFSALLIMTITWRINIRQHAE